jgi:hypothetical protein
MLIGWRALAASLAAIVLCGPVTAAATPRTTPPVVTPSAAAPAAAPAGEADAPGGEAVGRALQAVKLGAALAALGILVTGSLLRRRRRASRTSRARTALLLVVAGIAFGASYNFFYWRHVDGIHGHEFFHYFVGARYFPELGYYHLYECAVAAATEGRPLEARTPHEIRDLRHIENRVRVVPARSLPACRARFDDARWSSFRSDVLYFEQRLSGAAWERVLVDQGLNATPVWLLFGRSLAELVPVEPEALRLYARIDLLVLVAGFAAVGWAFGATGLSLAVLAWGAHPLTRYEWVGDAALRQLWFGSLLVGLSLLRRRRHAAAGVFLATSSLLRIFPVLFAAAYALREARRSLTTRRLDPGFVRFTAAGTAAGLLLVAVAIPVTGRGVGVIGELAENMSSYANLKALNSMGLPALASYTTAPPPPRLIGGRVVYLERDRMELNRRTFAARRPFYWAGVAALLVLLWRALPRIEDWEAACLGFVLVLALTQAASYYMSCIVGAALLGTRREQIAIATMATLAAWGAISLGLGETPGAYALSSAAALGLAVFTLIAVRRPPDASEPPMTDASTSPPTSP